ncbi:SMI1/KNR4 family protein [Listeria weihenstephanensis]|uniref:SMI1/KNR4 family protein n=1 Tax=Listeria weihenstephanensis TaxID=1006155 RepID=A0A841Z728_9LIST|nr:SMI1/KNR4 family protein [Listeria weihenstephanensis]MBC1501831.1 SMI1/KNR4 family protein [Listeria weihenstephanensis]
MKYAFLINNDKNSLYPLKKGMIEEAQSDLDVSFPQELIEFYNEVGCGFIKGSKGNINRFMDPISVRDFRKKEYDYEFFPDIDLYDDLEDELIFFEVDETVLMSIKVTGNDTGPVYYNEIKIADSLYEFLQCMSKDDNYYLSLINGA